VAARGDDAAEVRARRLRAALLADLDSGFTLVVREHQHTVFTTVLRICGHRDDAEDLTAEVFLKAYRALCGYPVQRIHELRLRPWLVTIALNLGRNRARDRSRRPRQVAWEEFVERSPPDDAFDDLADRLDQRRVLEELTGCLPEDQRVAVVLRHLCDMPPGEIAAVLGCSEGTVRSHVSRALGRLRALLGEHGAGPAGGGAGTTIAQGTGTQGTGTRGEEEVDGRVR
jgi:RNA polymerase sigma-70 factor (ECF subfamily)